MVQRMGETGFLAIHESEHLVTLSFLQSTQIFAKCSRAEFVTLKRWCHEKFNPLCIKYCNSSIQAPDKQAKVLYISVQQLLISRKQSNLIESLRTFILFLLLLNGLLSLFLKNYFRVTTCTRFHCIRQFNKCVKNSAKSSVRLVLLRETETMYNGKLQRGIEYTEHKRPCIIY